MKQFNKPNQQKDGFMKKTTLFLLLIITICAPSLNYAFSEDEICIPSLESIQFATHGNIDAKGLKTMIDSGTPFVLLDARGTRWHDIGIIPGAKFASNEYSAEEISTLIPNSESLVVVYCFTYTCPFANRLVDHLLTLGYKNIIKYPGGLSEWRDVAQYPVEQAELL